jgi:hypothetical protein
MDANFPGFEEKLYSRGDVNLWMFCYCQESSKTQYFVKKFGKTQYFVKESSKTQYFVKGINDLHLGKTNRTKSSVSTNYNLY